jgi:hypothetical protein
VQVHLLEVLEQDAALPLHDRLRQTRRAGRVEHPQRMVERHRLELQLRRAEEAVLPAAAVEVTEPHDRRGDLGRDRVDRVAAVEVAPAVAVAVDREQQLRLDLAEPVADAAHAELGRRRRPDRAERGGRQERRDRLGDVRQIGGDAIARADAARAQAGADPPRLLAQLSPGPLRKPAQLGRVEDRHAVVGLAAEQPLGVVEPRAREPHRAGHRGVGQHAVVRAADIEALPDRRPEAFDVLDRPAPQRVVVAGAALGHEAGHVRPLAQLGGRLPQQRPLLHAGRSYPPAVGAPVGAAAR